MELSSRSFSNMQLRKQQPNKRLKLAGGDRSKGSGVLCPWRGTDCRPLHLRRRASRPQLKRDPLGGIAPFATPDSREVIHASPPLHARESSSFSRAYRPAVG